MIRPVKIEDRTLPVELRPAAEFAIEATAVRYDLEEHAAELQTLMESDRAGSTCEALRLAIGAAQRRGEPR